MKAQYFLSFMALTTLSGCATMMRGSSEKFIVQSEPSNAEATLSNGMQCTTPCALKLKRKEAFTVTISKPGYKTVVAKVSSQEAQGSGSGVADFIMQGGLIGAGVNAASGAKYDLTPNPLKVTLEPESGGEKAPEAADAAQPAPKK